VPVCRFEGLPGVGPASHFYTANAAECEALRAGGVWRDEGIAFRARTACASNEVPVTRLWRAGATVQDSRHRFAVHQDTVAEAIADRFTLEGEVFCVRL
jgi:serine protease